MANTLKEVGEGVNCLKLESTYAVVCNNVLNHLPPATPHISLGLHLNNTPSIRYANAITITLWSDSRDVIMEGHSLFSPGVRLMSHGSRLSSTQSLGGSLQSSPMFPKESSQDGGMAGRFTS